MFRTDPPIDRTVANGVLEKQGADAGSHVLWVHPQVFELESFPLARQGVEPNDFEVPNCAEHRAVDDELRRHREVSLPQRDEILGIAPVAFGRVGDCGEALRIVGELRMSLVQVLKVSRPCVWHQPSGRSHLGRCQAGNPTKDLTIVKNSCIMTSDIMRSTICSKRDYRYERADLFYPGKHPRSD